MNSSKRSFKLSILRLWMKEKSVLLISLISIELQNNMDSAFFFQTQQILDDTILLNELEQQKIFLSYFQMNRNYYLFLSVRYAQKFIDIYFLSHSVEVIQELDSKERKIRSLRGFFLYALEFLEVGKNSEILETNLQPFFWKNVKNKIRQNKKTALQEFLFNRAEEPIGSILHLEDQIQRLQNQVNSFQDRISDLETKLTFEETSKYAFSRTLEAPKMRKSIQQGIIIL